VATSAAIIPAEPQQNASLMTVIERLSSNPNVDIDKIRQMLEMQERWEVNKDKSQLSHAMAEFKKSPPEIIKKRLASFDTNKGVVSYSYADLENITSAIIASLAQYGVTHSWKIAEGDKGISVTCVLRYGLYETEGVTLTAPPDTSGTKNAIQAKGSTISYLEKYTLLAATGMAAGMPDSDGNTAPQMEGYSERLTVIQGAANLVELKSFWQQAVGAARKVKDAASEKDFTDAKEKRKAELEQIQ
jgi:hypothetical protein